MFTKNLIYPIQVLSLKTLTWKIGLYLIVHRVVVRQPMVTLNLVIVNTSHLQSMVLIRL